MSWIAQLTGHASATTDDDARDQELALADELRGIAQKLTDLGHTGIAATFTGQHTGTANLLAAPAEQPEPTGDALGGDTPQPPAAGETQPKGQTVPDGTPAPLQPPAEGTEGAQETPPSTPGYVPPPQGSEAS